MKKTMKRAVALILTICTLFGIISPAVSATGGEQITPEPVEFVYNFYPDGYRGQFKNHNQTIRDLYEGEEFNWRYEAGSERVENAVADDSTTGTNVQIMNNQGFRALILQGDWFAFRLRVPEAGKYDLSLVHGLMANGARQANVYILPGSTTNIAEAIAAADPLGEPVSFKADANDYSETTTPVATWDCTAAGEYILVFEGAQSASDTSTHAYMVFYRLLLTEAEGESEQPEQSDRETYDLTAVEELHDQSLINGKPDSLAALDALNTKYENGDSNWNYEGNYSDIQAVVVGGTTNIWSGVRFGVKKETAGWVAVRIQSPGTGDYSIAVDYQTRKIMGVTSVYVLSGTTEDIAAALENATPVGSYDGYVNSDNYADASITFENTAEFAAGEEYILVFSIDNTRGSGTVYGTVNKVTVWTSSDDPEVPEEDTVSPEDTTAPEEIVPEETVPPVQLDKAEYDLTAVKELHDHSLINGKPESLAALDALNTKYENGDSNWNYEGNYSDIQAVVVGGTTNIWSGVRFGVKKETAGWVAVRIQSPGTGDYSIAVDYQTRKIMGVTSVYVLSGTTEDIAAALENATPVGSYDGYANSDNYADASITFENTAEFAAGEEYILVFSIDNTRGSGTIYGTVSKVTVKIPSGEDEEPEKPTVPEVTVPAVQLDKAQYDFTEVEAVQGTSFGRTNATLNALYESGKINWTYAGRSENNQATVMGGTNPETGKYTGAWSGMRFAAKPGGGWVAYRIVAPGTGNYTVTVDYQVNKALGNAAVYVLPGETTNIDAALVTATELGTYSCYNSGDAYVDASKTFVKTAAFTSGKEYLLVFYIANKNETGNIYTTVNGVTLNITAEAVKPDQTLDQMIYDFDLGHSDLLCQDKTFANRNVTHSVVDKTVEGFYYDGILNWNYRSATPDMYMIAGFGGIADGTEYKWNGLCMYARNDETKKPYYNFYYAFNIRSPGTGEYKLTLDYGVHTNGASQGSIYILPGDTADIGAAIAAGKAIGTVNYDNGATDSAAAAVPGRSTYGNAVTMEAGKEYILVFTSDAVGRANARLFVDSVTLTKVGVATPADIIPYRKPAPKPIPAGSTVYDLDLRDPVHGIYTGNTLINLVTDELHERYVKGIDNWDYVGQRGNAADDTVFHRHGLTVYAKEMDWLAIKVKAPKAGLYSVGLNYAISGNGGTTAVYVLPADTEDIDAAIDPSCRIGLMSFTNDTGITTPDDGYQTFVGTWEFGEEEEYIIVFEGYKRSAYPDNRAYMMISQLFLTPGDVIEDVEEEKTINAVVADPGPVKLLGGTYYGATQNINGIDYLYMPIEGKKMLIFDLDNNVITGEVEIPFTMNRGITVDENGIVWLSGDKAQLFRYDPYTGVGEAMKLYKKEVPDAQSGYWAEYADGCIYFGTYPSGCVVKYEIATDTYTNLGSYSDDISYANGVLYKDGYIYAGMNGDKNGDGKKTWVAVKMDAATGEIVGYTDIYDMVDPDRTSIYGAGFAGDLLLIGGESTQTKFIAIDINTMELVDVGVNGGISYSVTEEVDGKVYFVLNGMGLYSMDVATRKVEMVTGLKDTNIPIRCNGNSFVEVDDPLYPGPSIVTYSTGQGIPRIYNLEKGAIKTYHEAVDPDYGNPTSARALINGLPGSNELYMGGYNTHHCAVYNTLTGISENFESASDQTDVMLFYKDVLYTGNYAAGCVTRINLEDNTRNQVLLTLNDEIYDQARIHTLAAGDDMLFAGSAPDKFQYGGCIAIIDLNTLERYVERNVVQDQTINCLVYHDGYLYGTTSVYGGTGTAVREDLSAKIFVYDVANRKKVAEFDLRDYISGFEGNIEFISGFAADPNIDENGRFWGLVSETLFTFSYDVESGKFTAREEISYDKNTYNATNNKHWFPRPFRFDDNGNLYVAFENNGGLRRINTENTADHERVMPYTPIHYVLGEDGNLYYLNSYSLCMYPLNVTEEDWAKADAVDQMILAIGDKITLDSEEKIMAVRAAYDALDVKDKALVQKLYLLEEAEADLLELQIAALPETITVEHQDLLQGLQEKYDSMSDNQQRFVKNYDVLRVAQNALKLLLDKQAAAEVQSMIDSIKDLGELTLDHKDRIIEIRAAYDALTSYQKQYVDATVLLEAEAKMAVLRAEAIEHLKALIASIGEVTLEDEPVINEANEIFSWLTLEERQQVDGATLSAAKIALTKLQKAAAAEVDALIDAIGTVGRTSGDAIAAARAAYDALTPGSKAYVEKLAVLEAAEAAFAQYGGLGTVGIIAIVAAVVAAAGIAAVVLLVPDVRRKLFKR